MAQDHLSFLQGPKMDWTEDAKLHKRYTDWRRGTVDLRDIPIKCKGHKDQGEICNSMGRQGSTHIP